MKIGIIGAGSVGFTRKLVRDLLTVDALRDCEIALHDISAADRPWAWWARAARARPPSGGRSSASAGSTAGTITFRGQRIEGLDRRRMRPLRSRLQVRLPGSVRLAQPPPVGEADHRGGADRQRHRRLTRRDGWSGCDALLGEVWLPDTVLHRFPHEFLRRTAPAYRHRARPGAGAGVPSAGRANLRPGPLRPGADRRPAARPAAAPRHRLPLHQP